MSNDDGQFSRARLALAVAMSLALSLAPGKGKASESELPTGETKAEEENKRKKKKKRSSLPEDNARAQTAKVQAGLPDLGGDDDARADAAKKQAVATQLASSIASTAGAVLGSKAPNAEGLTDAWVEQAVNAGLSAGVKAANRSNNDFLGNLSGNVSMGEGGLDFDLQTIGVLAGKGSNHLLLGQLGAHNQMDRPTANVGLVYRYLLPSRRALFGANVFYDHDFDSGAHRVGVGAEMATTSVRAFANAYAPLSDEWFDISGKPDLQERAASGYDLGMTWSPAQLPGLDMTFKGAQWEGERVDVFNTGQTLANPTVWSAKVGYTPVPLFGISVEHEKAIGGPDDTRVMLNFQYKFGESMSSQLDRRNVAKKNDLVSRATAPVERENRIVMEQREKDVPLQILGPSLIRATIREDETYAYQVQLAPHNAGAVTFALSGIDAGVFTLDGNTVRLDPSSLAKPLPGEDSVYGVVVTVTDGRGRRAQKEFVIEVLWLDVDNDGLDLDKERELGTDPNNPDTDGDGLQDGEEVQGGTDPLDPNDPGVGNVPTAVQVLMDGSVLGGIPIVGSTLAASVTCSGDGKCPPTLRYQWQIESAVGSGVYVDIPGATGSTHTVRNTEQRRRIRVAVDVK